MKRAVVVVGIKRAAVIVAVVIGIYILVMIGIMVLFLWPARPTFEELSRAQRPESGESAVCYAVNFGGATVGYGYEVYLNSADQKRGRMLWSAYKLKPEHVAWIGPDSLDV